MKIQEKAAGARTARHKGRRGQVLLVSRAMDCLGRGLMDALDEAGLEADQVDCGSWAVARVVQGAVDLVLLDLNLPELGALELILCIRRFWPELPIVALAGAEPDSASAARLLGAHATLQQPVECGALIETVRFLLPDADCGPWQQPA